MKTTTPQNEEPDPEMIDPQIVFITKREGNHLRLYPVEVPLAWFLEMKTKVKGERPVLETRIDRKAKYVWWEIIVRLARAKTMRLKRASTILGISQENVRAEIASNRSQEV